MKHTQPHLSFTRTLLALVIGPAILLNAQTATLKLGTYECPATIVLQVISCSGAAPSDTCEVQASATGQPARRGPMPRAQVTALMPQCHAQTPAEAAARAKEPAAPAAGPQVSPAGFKVGDKVSVNTGFGWLDATVTSFSGNDYHVHISNGTDLPKSYPSEVRRIGPPNAYDRANGIYELKDKIQVNFEGKWVDSKITSIMGMDYQVEVPGNRLVWTSGSNLRLAAAVAETPKAAAPKPGQSPKPGMTSCAGKIEGRYAASNGLPYTMVFRSGKATITAPLMGNEEADCWTGGGKIYLTQPGEPDGVDIDINDDGTLQTPMGEMKKKGN